MKQFIISRCQQTWGTEYSVADYETKEAVLHAIHNQGWKNKIDAYRVDGALIFSMKCRDLFGMTYDVINADGSVMGVLERESWLSPLLQVADARSGQKAQVIKVSPSLYEEFRLILGQETVCFFRKADSSSSPLICCCLDDSQVGEQDKPHEADFFFAAANPLTLFGTGSIIGRLFSEEFAGSQRGWDGRTIFSVEGASASFFLLPSGS